MYYHTYGAYPAADGLLSFLVWVIVIALAILIIRAIVGHGHWHGMHHRRGGRAIELLKERYVKGEITKQQFEDIKKDLTM